MKKYTIDQAIQYIKLNITDSGIVFAVRGDNYIPRRKFRKSWNRPDGIKTTRKSGVCGLFIAKYNSWDEAPNDITAEIIAARKYGKHVFLLAGYDYYDGNDEYDGMWEIVIKDHKIIAEISFD